MDRETFISVTRTSLRTKVHVELADLLTEVRNINKSDNRCFHFCCSPIPVFSLCCNTLEDAFVLTCNVNSGFFYKTAGGRHKLVKAERKLIEDRVMKLIELKNKVCTDTKKGFVVINQKADSGLRRCSYECLGHAGLVYEHTLGEEKYTFIEKCGNPRSLTLLVKGPNKNTLTQIKHAVRDGLRAVKNAIEDALCSHGALEVAAADALVKHKPKVKGRAQLGVQAFADALLIIPKNSGCDPQETLVKVQSEFKETGALLGVDLSEPMIAGEAGVWEHYSVKKQLEMCFGSCICLSVITTNILLVDEIFRAGMSSLKG
uniref:Chaperonin containing TCP1, subunit 6A (zeta 1) n=1 Tax=Cyprinus carpio TaxID=7962 RepID=A0A8C1W684_CYPCA